MLHPNTLLHGGCSRGRGCWGHSQLPAGVLALAGELSSCPHSAPPRWERSRPTTPSCGPTGPSCRRRWECGRERGRIPTPSVPVCSRRCGGARTSIRPPRSPRIPGSPLSTGPGDGWAQGAQDCVICFAVNLPPGVEGRGRGKGDTPSSGHPISDPCLCSLELGSHQLSHRSTSTPSRVVCSPHVSLGCYRNGTKGFSYTHLPLPPPPVFLGVSNFPSTTTTQPPPLKPPVLCISFAGAGTEPARGGGQQYYLQARGSSPAPHP